MKLHEFLAKRSGLWGPRCQSYAALPCPVIPLKCELYCKKTAQKLSLVCKCQRIADGVLNTQSSTNENSYHNYYAWRDKKKRGVPLHGCPYRVAILCLCNL